jgi:hypothetical protein
MLAGVGSCQSGGGMPHDDTGWGRLDFDIVDVQEGRKPTKEPPFHVAGGRWTFLDCRGGTDALARFTVGLLVKGKDDAPVEWGKAWLAVPDRQAGTRLLGVFASTFFTDAPPSRVPQYPLQPLPIHLANLDLFRWTPGAGPEPPRHGWHRTKWFLQAEGYAEVYFDYNLELKTGSFLEKERDYRVDLVGMLAVALRDGSKPFRRLEDDPNLTPIGPRPGMAHLVLGRRSPSWFFSPGGRTLIYQDGKTVFALDLGGQDDAVELARFEYPPSAVHAVDERPNLLVQEPVPANPSEYSSNDPARVWYVPRGEEMRLLRGPQRHVGLGERPISPDGRYAILTKWGVLSSSVSIAELRTGAIRDINGGLLRSLDPIGWRGCEGGPLLVLAGPYDEDTKVREIFLADPATGVCVPTEQEQDDSTVHLVSPDGRVLAEVEGQERLVLTDLGTGQRRDFLFHPDDRPFVRPDSIEWKGSRYLLFHGQRKGLINKDTLKMNFPFPENGPGEATWYSICPDLSWVAYVMETSDGGGLYLAPMFVPPG